MNKIDLQKKLKFEKIPSERYSLDGGLPYDKICLSQDKNQWEVYYSERGNKLQLKVFDKEEDACEYFYNWLIEELKFDQLT